MEWPASAKRGGASAKIRRAITAILSSRMWLATVTGPNGHSAGITGAYIRGDDARPGTSKIGIVLSMLVSGAGEFDEESAVGGNPQIKSQAPPVKYAQTACESALSGFDAAQCGDYVMRS